MFKEKYFGKENIGSQAEKLLWDCGVEDNYRRHIYHPDSPALLVTDMQNFFLSPESRAYAPSAEAIVEPINNLIELFRERSLPIIFTIHKNDEYNAGMMAKRWKYLIPENNILSELHNELSFSDDILLSKSQYDAFYATELDAILKAGRIKSLVITGVLQNLCIETTLRSAFVRGYAPLLPVDCTAAYNYDLHLSSLKGITSGFCSPCLSKDIIELIIGENG